MFAASGSVGFWRKPPGRDLASLTSPSSSCHSVYWTGGTLRTHLAAGVGGGFCLHRSFHDRVAESASRPGQPWSLSLRSSDLCLSFSPPDRDGARRGRQLQGPDDVGET